MLFLVVQRGSRFDVVDEDPCTGRRTTCCDGFRQYDEALQAAATLREQAKRGDVPQKTQRSAQSLVVTA